MLDIYQKVFTVLVWLGKPDQDSELATKQISMINKLYNFAYGTVPRYKLTKVALSNINSQTFKALGYFFARPYWARIWIIQELSVVQKETRLICGKESIILQALSDVLDLFLTDWDRFLSGIQATSDEKFQHTGNTFILPTRLQ